MNQEPKFRVGQPAPLEFDEIFDGFGIDDLPCHLDMVAHLLYCVRGVQIPNAAEAARLRKMWREHQKWKLCKE